MKDYLRIKTEVVTQIALANEIVEGLESQGIECDTATLLDEMAKIGIYFKKPTDHNYTSLAYLNLLGMDMDTMLDQLGVQVP